MIDSKTPDPGGVSYGSFQFTSQYLDDKGVKHDGAVQDFMKSKDFELFADKFHDKHGHPLKVNSEAFKEAWRNMDDPIAFEHAQYDFAMRRYHGPQIDRLEKAGFHARGRSEAFDNAVTSASVQHGQNATVIVDGLRHKAHALGKPMDKLSDREAITGIYEQRARFYKTTLSRYAPEMKEDLDMLSRERGQLASPPPDLSPDHSRRIHHGDPALVGGIVSKGHDLAPAPSHMSPSGAAEPGMAAPDMPGAGAPRDLLIPPLAILEAIAGLDGVVQASTAGGQESGMGEDRDDPFGRKEHGKEAKGGKGNRKAESGNMVSDYHPGMTPR